MPRRSSGCSRTRASCATVYEIPGRTPESDALSKDLKKRGFRFAGSTICYAFMQAVGMVNDHLTGCYRHDTLSGMDLPALES